MTVDDDPHHEAAEALDETTDDRNKQRSQQSKAMNSMTDLVSSLLSVYIYHVETCVFTESGYTVQVTIVICLFMHGLDMVLSSCRYQRNSWMK